jgi:putative peptide zinc metalloprotease protein
VTATALPPLREDLQILRAGPSYSGAPGWVLHDPVSNRFFKLGYEAFQLVSLWNAAKTREGLDAALMERYGRTANEAEFSALLRLLEEGELFADPPSGGWRSLHATATRRRGWFMSAVHNYLFFKIHLVRPQRFLALAWPSVRPLFTLNFLILMALIAAIGLLLVSRQWDVFARTFSYVFTLEGAAVSIVSLILVKSLHELGHAFMAHRFGCKVPSMGIAFLVLAPMLYTDVSDTWRLKSRYRRMLVDAAGMLTELCIAALALLLWVFLPDGPLRSAAFVLATVGWVLSLVINASPLMRFDGYYMLADFLGVENLQDRAFAHLRWRLRRLLFATGEEPPESFPRRLDIILTVYAIATTIYRLLLYIAIALLVYHFFFKLAGVILFVVEIAFFIVRPIWLELKEWWHMRRPILTSARTYVSLAVSIVALGLFLMPFATRISAPALLQPENFARLFPEEAGRIAKVHVRNGDRVREGDLLVEIAAPEIAQARRLNEVKKQLAETRLARIGADPRDLEERGVIEKELASLAEVFAGLARREAALEIRAPFAGRVADLNTLLREGRWIARNEVLGVIIGGEGAVARGYVQGDDLGRLSADAKALFVPDDLTQTAVPMALKDVAVGGAEAIDIAQLTSVANGPIAVEPNERRQLVPAAAQYAILAVAGADVAMPAQTRRGVLLLDGKPESLASRVWRQVLKVLVREASA